MKTYGYAWIDFLANKNVVKVTNKEEFDAFKAFLKKINLTAILMDLVDFSDWQQLAFVNDQPQDLFLFEYDNTKGLTWQSNMEEIVDWYGCEPINAMDLIHVIDDSATPNFVLQEEAKANISFADIVKATDYINQLTDFVPQRSKLHDEKEFVLKPFVDYIEKTETERVCPRCGNPLFKSDLPQYDYICTACDENF